MIAHEVYFLKKVSPLQAYSYVILNYSNANENDNKHKQFLFYCEKIM